MTGGRARGDFAMGDRDVGVEGIFNVFIPATNEQIDFCRVRFYVGVG